MYVFQGFFAFQCVGLTIILQNRLMTIIEIILLAVALAMDCFTVSVVNGIVMQRRVWSVILQLSVLFGVFQALMPLIGWALTTRFTSYIESYDHWVAFALLLFLGLKMVRDAFLPDNQQSFDATKLKTQLTLAVTTSIDALTVGISMSMMGYDEDADSSCYYRGYVADFWNCRPSARH